MPSESKPKREPAPMSSPLGHIAVNVRRRRKAMGLTQAALSELVPCHPTYVSQIERRVTNISVERLEGLAKVLGVDALTLMQPPKPLTDDIPADLAGLPSGTDSEQMQGSKRGKSTRVQRT